MKTNFIAVIGMLTVLAVGCSKDLSVADENAWIYDESLPVPIEFGSLSSEIVSKAAINNFPAGEFSPAFGVFAWAENHSDGMQVSAESIFPAGYKRAQVWTSTGISKIYFQEQGASVKPAYYPMSSQYDYSFYAYHIGTEEIAGSYTDDESYVLNLDFSEPFNDVLWGKFADSDIPYGDELPHLFYNDTQIKGFNARFSRAAGKQAVVPKESYYPVINFEHICTAFRFYAKADFMDISDFITLRDKLKITSVSISNVPSSAVLTVASRESGKEGKLVPSAELETVEMNFDPAIIATGYQSKEGNGSVMKMTETNDDRFFLPAGDYSESVVTIGLTLDGNPNTLEFPLVYEGSSVFEAGKCYSFVVIFKTIEEISLRATLSPWDESPVTIVDLESLYN